MEVNVIKRMTAPVQKQGRGEQARRKLIRAGLELFSEIGFDAASTRNIAKAAKQNIAAINYYFGNKEGLYAAVIEDCLQHKRNAREIDPIEQIDALLKNTTASADQYLAVIKQWLRAQVMALALKDRQNAAFIKLLLREQFTPTAVFKRSYQKLFRDPITRLVAAYLGDDPKREETILIAHAIYGLFIGFLVAPEVVLLKTGWKRIGKTEAAAIADVVTEQVELTLKGLRAKRGDHTPSAGGRAPRA
jgi:AcrR family transcriptional regulator